MATATEATRKRRPAQHETPPAEPMHAYEAQQPHRFEAVCATCGALVFTKRYYTEHRSSLKAAARALMLTHRKRTACAGEDMHYGVIEHELKTRHTRATGGKRG
jgi:hypothetical protein